MGPGAAERLADDRRGAAASLATVWFLVGEPLVAIGFASGLLGIGALVWWLAQPRDAKIAEQIALPDWSVTVAAIARDDAAVAITDRAGRLVCANRQL